jgi:hypothetical protein
MHDGVFLWWEKRGIYYSTPYFMNQSREAGRHSHQKLDCCFFLFRGKDESHASGTVIFGWSQIRREGTFMSCLKLCFGGKQEDAAHEPSFLDSGERGKRHTHLANRTVFWFREVGSG